MEFAVKNSNENEIWFELRESEETIARYPFKFHLNIGYRIEGRSVTVLWRVKNTNDARHIQAYFFRLLISFLSAMKTVIQSITE